MRTPDGHIPRAARVRINEEFAPVEAFINEYVADLSSTGVFIKSKDPLPVGTRVNLKFSVILDELHVVEAAGEVVRRSDRPLGMGVAFRKLGPDAQKIIGRAIKERRERPKE
ncbi:MAG TPA: PilZ domain-containing protein [Polyangia bacterium]